MRFFYRLINRVRRLVTRKSVIIILIILFFLALILGKFLFYVEKKNWDNRVGELNYSLNFFTYIPNFTNVFNFYNYFRPSGLPKYTLKVSYGDLKKLDDALPEEFFGDLPEDSLYVPAVFYADGKKYNVEIKYRGLLSRHWRYRQKSWHVKFLDEYFHGQKEINFILPEEKDFLVEDYGYHVADKLGLTTLDTEFIRLKINNQSYGAYWMTENWDSDFLERHELSSDANFYREEELEIYENAKNWRKYTGETHSSASNSADLDLLINCLKQCNDQEFLSTMRDLIDMDNFLRWQAHTAILGDDHQDYFHNIRLYFNPLIGQFQFFPVDVNQYKFNGQFDIYYNPLVGRLLLDPEIMHQRNVIIWNYVNDEQNVSDDIKYYEDLWAKTKTAFYKDRVKRFSNWYFNYRVSDRYEKIKNQYKNLKVILSENKFGNDDIEVKKPQNNITEISLTVENFSDISLRKIVYQGNLGGSSLFYDINKNNIFDSQDLKLAIFNYYREGYSETAEFDISLFAKRSLPENFEQLINILPTTYSFFVVADRNIEVEKEKINFELFNAVTNEKIIF